MNLSVKQKILLSLWLMTFLLLTLTGGLASAWFTRDQSNRLDDFLSHDTRGFQKLLNTFVSAGDKNVGRPALDSPEFRAFLSDYFQQRLNWPLPYMTSLVTVLAIVFVAFGTLGTVLIHWSLRWVREMSVSAQDISESHLDLRLAVPPGRDEIAAMAETLNKLIARLERDFQFEEALVGQLSHELRTPLTILRGRNEVALGRRPTEAVKRVLEDNLADIDNIASLLNTLFNLARLDGRMEPAVNEPCDLIPLLRDLIDELEPLWDEKQIRFRLALAGKAGWEDSEPLMAVGDAFLLRQVFLNLLTNAYKYTPAWGEIGISVNAAGTREAPTWRVVVRNPGPPVPEEALEMVFKRFYRVEAQHPESFERASGLEQSGFGLGLSIAKSMVELQNGRIRAFNPDNGGAAFEVLLPRPVAQKLKERSRI